MTVDTLSLPKELRLAELSATQAGAIDAAIGRAVVEGAATKADVQQAKLEVEAKIEQLRSTLMAWFIGTIFTLAAIIIAVVKL